MAVDNDLECSLKDLCVERAVEFPNHRDASGKPFRPLNASRKKKRS